MTSDLQRIERGDVLTPPPNAAATLLDVIGRAAKDPAVDVEKMERLMAMQERILARQAEAEFGIAMQAAQSRMPVVQKDARNTATKSRYARLETLYRAVVPVITEHGFSISFGTTDCPLAGHFRITARVMHAGGHSVNYQADIPSDHLGPQGNANKTLVHGFGSAMSYGRRYLTMLIFNVSTGEDDDGNGAGGEDNSPESVTALRKQLWDLLKPVRGEDKPPSWRIANQWLWDECAMDPDTKVERMDAIALRQIISAAQKKLRGQQQGNAQ